MSFGNVPPTSTLAGAGNYYAAVPALPPPHGGDGASQAARQDGIGGIGMGNPLLRVSRPRGRGRAGSEGASVLAAVFQGF
jgi:hypothetical protein